MSFFSNSSYYGKLPNFTQNIHTFPKDASSFAYTPPQLCKGQVLISGGTVTFTFMAGQQNAVKLISDVPT